MRVLILGVTGMLGHKLTQVLSRRFEVTGTVRDDAATYSGHPVLGKLSLLGGVRAEQFESVVGTLARVQPATVINCVGIVKQSPAGRDPLPSIAINALFPHRLAQLCQATGSRLIHISTDCVFSGRKGKYTEDDISDAEDLYGRTKYLGEVAGPGCITLRTSIIGRELHGGLGLIEWFMRQRGGTVRGYTQAIYTGFPTQILAELIGNLLVNYSAISGLWHVSSAPISKYKLLELVNQVFGLQVTVERDEIFACDRSLDGTRFRQATGYEPPTWEEMIVQMAGDPTPYDELRNRYAL